MKKQITLIGSLLIALSAVGQTSSSATKVPRNETVVVSDSLSIVPVTQSVSKEKNATITTQPEGNSGSKESQSSEKETQLIDSRKRPKLGS